MKALALAALLSCFASLARPADSIRFAIIGDTPYTDAERALMPSLLETIAQSGASFAIHLGDFKSGHSACSDELFADRRKMFDASPIPVIYVPGDNEWTDCHRTSNGGYDPVERLGRLRRVFFADPRSLGGSPMDLERQSVELPEHLRWRAGPALFVTLNVPGTDNNWGARPAASAEHRQRMPMVLRWLRAGFAEARRSGLRFLVIGMQANPDFRSFSTGTPLKAYAELLTALVEETLAFPGEVILLHGDTHWMRIDRPLHLRDSRTPIANFMRVESYGSPFMGWIGARLSPREAPSFEPHAHGSGPRLP